MARGKHRKITQVKGDRQVWPLYWAERAFLPQPKYSPKLTQKRATEITEVVREWFKLPPITILTVNKPRWNESASAVATVDADNEQTRARIRINVGRRPITLPVLLHELAHVITDHAYGLNKKVEPHGREFAGVATYLYDRFRVIPEDALRVIWRRYKVRAFTAVESSPRALRVLRKRRLKRG
jgi:hypothetical protein